jgi:hypothetical protein
MTLAEKAKSREYLIGWQDGYRAGQILQLVGDDDDEDAA